MAKLHVRCSLNVKAPTNFTGEGYKPNGTNIRRAEFHRLGKGGRFYLPVDKGIDNGIPFW